MTLIKKIFLIFVMFGVLGLVALFGLYLYVKPDLPSVKVLKDVELQIPMQVFTADGKLINQYGEKRRIPVRYEDIPPQLINALLATEDSRFYEHPGVDPIGVVRSAIVLISTGQKKQGASTITMQLARNFFFTREKKYIRKIKEIFAALHIEQLLTKQEILELYLNKIELGHRAFGIGAAAQVYYGKELSELTLPQMAMIAGLPKAPSSLNPIRNPQRAKQRRNVVLYRMLEEKHITKVEYDIASQAPITARFHGAQLEASAPYVSEMVRKQMVEQFGEDKAYTHGFKVFTTVDSSIQTGANQAVINNLHDYDMRHGYKGPEKYLWNAETEAALEPIDILEELRKVKEIGQLKAAVITQVDGMSAQALLRSGEFLTLDWDSFKWARSFISDSKQGPAPENIGEILSAGAQIWLRELSAGQYQLSQIPEASGALVALDPRDGAISAVVGGYSFQMSQYNRATQAKRQVGSNIKPFLYSSAIEQNYTLASVINDAPINRRFASMGVTWRPENSPAVYDGPIRLRQALAKSKNVVAVRLLQGVGLNNVVDHLLKFGFSPDDIHRNESLALGSASLTPLEMVSGMAAFANGGFLIDPYVISKIENREGEIIHQAQPLYACPDCSDEEIVEGFQYAPRVISPQNAFLIANAMQSTIRGGGNWNRNTGWNGTGWRARRLGRNDLPGKTGTTNDFVDTWFSGFNANLVATTWVGFDNHSKSLGRSSYNKNLSRNQSFGAESGARTALPAWINFMEVALKDQPAAPVDQPEGLESVRIDLTTGLLTNKTDYTSKFEYFIKGTSPAQFVKNEDHRVFEIDPDKDREEQEELF